MAPKLTKEESTLLASVDKNRLPRHVAFIMDGNGRWAKKHRFKRIMGHRAGIKSVRETVTASKELGLKVLSLYAFSEENWRRPRVEVEALMYLLKHYLVSERKLFMDNDIRLISAGNLSRLPKDAREELDKTMRLTRDNKAMILNLALSYGSRDEILRAVKRMIEDIKEGRLDSIDQETFSKYLDTAGLPDPDLLIRTSGELRVSNFMLWQIAYTEMYITDVLWPDFRRADLYRAIIEYQKRERRFGLVSEQVRKGLLEATPFNP